MHQIRSNNKTGTRAVLAHARFDNPRSLSGDSRLAERAGVLFALRTEQPRCSDTGVLEYNGGFQACADGQWRELVFSGWSS